MRGRRSIAGVALGTASAFLTVMAILIGSTALFYITTALIAMLLACRLQARLAVTRLRFERIAPESVRVGDIVTVEVVVWSEVRFPRPLITVSDNLPVRLAVADLSPSLPVAPAFDAPIRTQYRFRPMRRGRFRWSDLVVEGTDSLGLATKQVTYETSAAEMLVLPRPVPLSIDLPAAAGWGISEAETGSTRGAGIEPWGIRQYSYGDSLRKVHWRSTARTGQLLVKEFEAGSQAAAAFVFQRTEGSEIGLGAHTTLELMCGHAAYLAEMLLRHGARVELPGLEERASHLNIAERTHEIYNALAGVQANRSELVSSEVLSLVGTMPPGSLVFVLVSLVDEALPEAIVSLSQNSAQIVVLLYDPLAFTHGKHLFKGRSAVDHNFVERLRLSGGSPVVVPTEPEEGGKK